MPEASIAFGYFLFAVVFAWYNIDTQDVTARSQIHKAVVGKYKTMPYNANPQKVFRDIATPSDFRNWLNYAFLPITFAERPEKGASHGYCTISRPCYLKQGACRMDNQCFEGSTCSDRTAVQDAVLVNGEYWDTEDLKTWCDWLGTPVDFSLPPGALQPCDPQFNVHSPGNAGPCCWDKQTDSYITAIDSINVDSDIAQSFTIRRNCPSYLPFDINCCAPSHNEALQSNETSLTQDMLEGKTMPAEVSSFNKLVAARLTMKRYKPITRERPDFEFVDLVKKAIAGGSAKVLSHSSDNSNAIEDKSTFGAHGRLYDWVTRGSYQDVGGYAILLPEPFDYEVWKSFLTYLWMDHWFDRRMASCVLDMLFYNGNADTFLYLTFVAEFHFTGAANTYIRAEYVNLNVSQWKGRYFLPRLLEVILTVAAFLLLLLEFKKIRESKLNLYFSQFIRVFDLVSLLLCIAVLAMNFIIFDKDLFRNFTFENFDTIDVQTKMNIVGEIVNIMDLAAIQQFIVAINLMMIFLRAVMQVTSLDGKLGLMINTVSVVAPQLCWFSLMFLLLLAGFVGFVYFTFGTQPELTGVKSVIHTWFVTFGMLVGGVNMEALVQGSPALAPAFFVVFYVVLLFVMVNMFISILLSGYDQVYFELQESKASNMNLIFRLYNEVKSEVMGKCLSKCFSVFAVIWRDCLRHVMYGLFQCIASPMQRCSTYVRIRATIVWVIVSRAVSSRHKMDASLHNLNLQIRDSKRSKKLAKQRIDSYSGKTETLTIELIRNIKETQANLSTRLKSAEERLEELKELHEKAKSKSDPKMLQEENKEQTQNCLLELREARIDLQVAIKHLDRIYNYDLSKILIFWCLFISMMILVNRSEVGRFLSKATTHSTLSTQWFSIRTPFRVMDFYEIHSFEDVGEWASQALTKLYSGPVCNRQAYDSFGITNMTLVPGQDVTFAGGCSLASCRGLDAHIHWQANLSTEDFDVISIFEPFQLLGTPLLFALWSGDVVHELVVYGTGCIFARDDTVLPGHKYTITVLRQNSVVTVRLDGSAHGTLYATIGGSLRRADITAVGWMPRQNKIKVHELRNNFEATWRRLYPGEELGCPNADDNLQLLQSTNEWNVGFLDASFVRVTVQPACFRTNPETRWRAAANYLRPKLQDTACSDSPCFVEALKTSKSQGTLCLNMDGEPIDVERGFGSTLGETAPYNYSTKGKLGPYNLLGGLVFNLGSTMAECQQMLQLMTDDGWFSKNSASIVFDWITYNGNFDVFTYNVASFSLLPTGKLDVGQGSFTIDLNMYQGGKWYADSRKTILVLYILYSVAVIFYVGEFLSRLLFERFCCHAHGQYGLYFLWSYFSDFWRAADTLSLVCSIAYIAQFAEYLFLTFRDQYKFSTSALNSYDPPRGDEAAFDMLKKTNPARLLQDDWYIFASFQNLVGKYYFLLNTAALNSFLMSLRVLQNVNKKPFFAVFASTLATGIGMQVYFMIVISLTMVGWTMFFTILFGHVDFHFSSVMASFGTMFEWMLGTFDCTDQLDHNETLTIIVFMCFQIVMKFVAINMFLATMLNTYSITVGEIEKRKVQAKVDREKSQVYVSVRYDTRAEFESEITIKRDEKGEVRVDEIREGKATLENVKPGALLFSINGEREEWKMCGTEKDIIEEAITPSAQDNKINLIFKDVQKPKQSPLKLIRRTLAMMDADQDSGPGGPRPTVKNFWRRHGAVSTVNNEILKAEADDQKQFESLDSEDMQGPKALEDDESDDLPAEDSQLDAHYVEDKSSRGKVKRRLEGLLFSRARHLTGGGDPFEISHDGLIAQDFSPADDGKMMNDCELDEIRNRIGDETVSGWEVWLDILVTQIEREPEMDIDSVVTEVLRTNEMRELRKGTTENSNVLRDFFLNASDILSVLEYKAKMKYFKELEKESKKRQKIIEDQNHCLNDYACQLEAEFEGLMGNLSSLADKRDEMKYKLHLVIGQDAVAGGTPQRSPRETTPRGSSPRSHSNHRGRFTREESDFEKAESWNYGTGRTHNWSWATGRWPGQPPEHQTHVRENQTHV